MADLGSAPIPPLAGEDHVAGPEAGEGLIVYSDLGCPHCASVWERLRARSDLRIAFRHFPVRSKHPRAPALHGAAEAAGRQGRFFAMVDSLYADRGHVDDPHLWERAERLGLGLERFEADRRAEDVAARVRADFESGIRAGVTATPAIFDACTLVTTRERQF
jgi:protein-disulfide isomerase